MIEVRTQDGQGEVFLTSVSHQSTAHHASHTLWASVHAASKIHGGRALIKKPEDGEFGFLVFWDGGPDQWADAYVADPESSARGFTAQAEDGNKVRFTDLD